MALDGSGNATPSVPSTPYLTARHRSGTMTTDYGFTGRREDATDGPN